MHKNIDESLNIKIYKRPCLWTKTEGTKGWPEMIGEHAHE